MKKSEASLAQTAANKAYKRKVYGLCKKVVAGDKAAEVELDRELATHSLARWAVKHWIKVNKNRPIGARRKKRKRKKGPGRTSYSYGGRAVRSVVSGGGGPGTGRRR